MSECIYQHECGNLDKACFKCFEYSKYKPLKQRVGLKAKSDFRKSKKEGVDFEKRGARKYNKAVTQKSVAHQQVGSGAFGGLLGDMITEEELTASLSEFKERGSVDAKGSKQITIKKEWLNKLKEEAREMNKEYYFLPFTFKGDDTDYVCMDFNIFLGYIQIIHSLLKQNEFLKKQLED